MPIDRRFQDQVRLLLRVLPIVDMEPVFALKGGTAINLFVRDLPRLSEDMDFILKIPDPDFDWQRHTFLCG